MKTLLFGTMYVDTQDKFEIFKNWYTCIKDSGVDEILLVDSDSPIDLQPWLETLTSSSDYFSFLSNIGHLNKTGKDGWGRAFCYGINYAIKHNYNNVVHIECDILFKPNILSIVNMISKETPVISTKAKPYNHLETGIMFMDVSFMEYINFIRRYDWFSKTKEDYPELIVEDIIGKDNIMYASWKGLRDDSRTLIDASDLDYMTHFDMPMIPSFMERLK